MLTVPPLPDYEVCPYQLMRSVVWQLEIDLNSDVYLSKALRAQQTISDISNLSDLIYRNLYPLYFTDGHVYITLQKATDTPYALKDNVVLMSSFLSMNEAVETLLNQTQSNPITYKTAVGSPGFLQLVLDSSFPGIAVSIAIFRALLGKTTTENGKSTGLLALIDRINVLLNDHTERKRINAQTDKLIAETDLVRASTRKTDAQAQAMELQNERAKKEREQNCLRQIDEAGALLSPILQKSGFEVTIDQEDMAI